MSSPSSKAAFALQDILLGIADGLKDAQHNLSNLEPYDEFGRPNTMYHLPYLDFNLQVTSEFQESSDGNNERVSYLRFQPALNTKNTSSKTEVFSTITGRFVATVPNEGLPQIIIDIEQGAPAINDAGDAYEVDLSVNISNAAGENLIGSLVEFNYDEITSDSFNTTTLVAPPVFSKSEEYTDGDGNCSITVSIGKADFDAGKYTVIQVNNGIVAKLVSINNL